jgi:hypothetical protein
MPYTLVKTVVTGEPITASDRNTEHQNHINNHTLSTLNDYSDDATEMGTTVDPYPAESESLATTATGEIERLRYQVLQIIKTHKPSATKWYHDPTGTIYYDADGYADINAAVTAIGATEAVLLVNSSQTLSANLTIPTTLTLAIFRGGDITKASTYTLTINGTLEAGNYKIFESFTGSGDVDITGNAIVRPEWWGAYNDFTNADVTRDAIQFAIDSLSNGGIVQLSAGTYAIDETVTLTGHTSNLTATTLAGLGPGSSMIKLADSSDTDMIDNVGNNFHVEIRDLQLEGNKANNASGYAISWSTCHVSRISRVRIRNTKDGGIKLNGCNDVKIDDVSSILSDGYGIELNQNCAAVQIIGGTLENNTSGGVYNKNTLSLAMLGTYFEGNSGWCVYHEGGNANFCSYTSLWMHSGNANGILFVNGDYCSVISCKVESAGEGIQVNSGAGNITIMGVDPDLISIANTQTIILEQARSLIYPVLYNKNSKLDVWSTGLNKAPYWDNFTNAGSGTATVTEDSSDARSGKCVKLSKTGTGWAAITKDLRGTDLWATGKRFTISCYVKADASISEAFYISIDSNPLSGNPSYHQGTWQDLTSTYKFYSESYTLNATNVSSHIICFTTKNTDASWNIFVDDIQISCENFPAESEDDIELRGERTSTSVDLSGAAETLVCLHSEVACTLVKATLLYREASSADAGITIEIGKESDRDYYYTGTTEVSKSQWYSKDIDLLANDIAAGDTVTFYSPGGKTGTGEIMLVIEYVVD